MIITIDGPAASGKSTLARAVAAKLNLFYIASGGLYRGLSYVLLNYFGYTLDNIEEPSIHDLKKALDIVVFKYTYDKNADEKIYFDGVDITPHLKTSIIDSAASKMAGSKIVNETLIAYQRLLADDHDIIIDGRNCGSQVFPQAHIKIYLTASLTVRAQRLQDMQAKKGITISLDQAEKQLKVRDARDSERTYAPLMIPDNAMIIDNSALTADQTVQKILNIIQAKETQI